MDITHHVMTNNPILGWLHASDYPLVALFGIKYDRLHTGVGTLLLSSKLEAKMANIRLCHGCFSIKKPAYLAGFFGFCFFRALTVSGGAVEPSFFRVWSNAFSSSVQPSSRADLIKRFDCAFVFCVMIVNISDLL